MVDLEDINTNNSDSTKYIIKFFRGKIIMVTKYFINSSHLKDILSIPIYSEDYINESNNITQEKLRISFFHKFYHLYGENLNPVMTSYLASVLNPCLD